VKIHWHSNTDLIDSALENKIQLEFNFRQKIIRFFIENNIKECCTDYSCYVFDYYVDSEKIEISKETPEPYYSKLVKIWKQFPLMG
tara:strand:- start:524 stop:781 length:258 start_codon:yes stop_codon:yes gene_type:complete